MGSLDLYAIFGYLLPVAYIVEMVRFAILWFALTALVARGPDIPSGFGVSDFTDFFAQKAETENYNIGFRRNVVAKLFEGCEISWGSGCSGITLPLISYSKPVLCPILCGGKFLPPLNS